jgi:signal transduction histidine kinase
VDADLFLQAIINLVDNALKFAHKADDKRIVLNFVVTKVELAVSVRDFGPGIAEKNLTQIFSLFYRVENELTRETKGTGIGLALVSEILELMHARIEVENCEPGARFTM